MSDTGSFHLPPPQTPYVQQVEHADEAQQIAQAHQVGQYQPPVYASPHDLTHALSSPQPRPDPSTASYTARVPQVPPAAPPVAQHRGRRARRRPGPPAKVAIPVLLLALACYAVGFWALTRI
jgi:serine/threonine-protein kinase